MIASKDQWKEVELYEMRWQKDAMEKAVNEKKEIEEEKLAEEWSKLFSEYRDNNELTDKEIKSMLRYIIKEVRHIERLV